MIVLRIGSWVEALANDIGDLGKKMRAIDGFCITINQHESGLSVSHLQIIIEVVFIDPGSFRSTFKAVISLPVEKIKASTVLHLAHPLQFQRSGIDSHLIHAPSHLCQMNTKLLMNGIVIGHQLLKQMGSNQKFHLIKRLIHS
jgi:hypothetical protein